MAKKNSGIQWPIWMKPGIRVVRGPDFASTIRDANVLNLGTLIVVPHQAGDNKVHVVWDTGLERRYKSGFTGEYELRAVDIQQLGVFHNGITCSGCKSKPLRGIRFHCPTDNTDFCIKCYMSDKGDVQGNFVRFDMPSDESVILPTRKSCKKLKLTGVAEKAKVVRGPHWCYPSKDGSALDEGTVMSIIAEKDGAINSWVRVRWDIDNEVGEYRFGANGFVDVIASKTVECGTVYADHLPLVGIVQLKLGNKVTVNLTLSDFKKAQTKADIPGGWTDDMKHCLSNVGTIIELLANSILARVQYVNGKTFLITKEALYRREGFKEGGVVKVVGDKIQLEKLQKGHGHFDASWCGQYGRLLSIKDDGDLKVLIGKVTVTINPTACEPINDSKAAKTAPAMPSDDEEDDDDDTPCVGGRINRDAEAMSDGITSIYTQAMKPGVDMDLQAKEMYDAMRQADLASVEKIIRKNKKLLGFEMDGKTIVHLVSNEGYKDLLATLIDLGGDIAKADEEGDTPLHYAAYANQTDCMQVLLQNGANPDIQNKSGTTALMITVENECYPAVEKLMIHGADVSIKDPDDDTAMHDAIASENDRPKILSAVLGSPTADYSLQNKKGFNVLQWAIFKDNRRAVDIILRKGCNVVEEKMKGGITPLHTASANDFIEVASLLLELGKAKVDSRDDFDRTPLHYAVIKSRKRAIEVLIDKKADVNAMDKDGDTPLHLTQKKLPDPSLLKTKRALKSIEEINIQITYFLLEKGADIAKKNSEGKTAMDYVQDQKLKDMLERVTAAYTKAPPKTQQGVRLPIHWTKMEVTDLEIVTLDTDEPAHKAEFTEVSQYFLETMDSYNLQKIHRVQNPLLWEHYTLKKREMEFKYGQGMANELHLYHGTRPDLVNIIARDNFDFRIAGSNVGALYGEGSYFAVTAKYSDLYASRNDDGNKVMFVAKVLAGKTAQGKPGLKRPPEVDPDNFKKGLYDCCVDNVLKPKIYCVFDVNQYYPEYIIEYC